MGTLGTIKHLTAGEADLVRGCIRAAVLGPFFPEWEFQTLMGVTRAQARVILEEWPPATEAASAVQLTINNVLGNLIGYPHGQAAARDEMVGADIAEVRRVFTKWRGQDDSPA
jgi:hypothetical protein